MLLKISDKLIGYENEFDIFKKLFESNNLPKTILIEGQKGIGKFTFAIHLINHFLNQVKTDIFSNLDRCQNLMVLNKNEKDKEYKIEDIRKIINLSNLKISDEKKYFVIIKDINFLNNNSINALLKVTEEQKNNVFFIFTADSSKPISETLKSRLFVQKLFLKKQFYKTVIENFIFENNITYEYEINEEETPGTQIRQSLISNIGDLNSLKKENEDVFLNIFSKKIISQDTDFLSNLKKLKLNLALKNDIRFMFKKY